MFDLHARINDVLEGNIRIIEHEPILDEINITNNGVYTPPEEIDGYNKITVNVPYITQLSDMQYNNLPSSEKMSGKCFLLPSGEIDVTNNFDMGNVRVVDRQSSMQIDYSHVDYTNINYVGGEMIGFTYCYATRVNLSEIDSLTYDVALTSIGYHNSNFSFSIGLVRNIPSAGYGDYRNIPFIAFNHYYNEEGTTLHDEEIDTSDLDGYAYILVFAPSWTARLSDIKTHSKETYTNKIMYLDNPYIFKS